MKTTTYDLSKYPALEKEISTLALIEISRRADPAATLSYDSLPDYEKNNLLVALIEDEPDKFQLLAGTQDLSALFGLLSLVLDDRDIKIDDLKRNFVKALEETNREFLNKLIYQIASETQEAFKAAERWEYPQKSNFGDDEIENSLFIGREARAMGFPIKF